jgi:hypothetical protein
MLARALDELAEHAREGRGERVLSLLHALVPEFEGTTAAPEATSERASAREP